MNTIWQQVTDNIASTGWLEYLAVITGIISVWFSKKEHILVFPVGLVSTIIYIFLSLQGHLFGEASVNLYYTIVSIYGWILWTRRNNQHEHVVRVTYSSAAEWKVQVFFFLACYVVLFAALTFLRHYFPGAIPWADAFASATAYTGMWLMARKKVESWYWWIATNIASIPLYFVKHYAVTSMYYVVLLVLAFSGLAEWKRKALAKNAPVSLTGAS